MKIDPSKMSIWTKIKSVAASAMILGSPIAAFWSFGASFMFFLVGLIWAACIGAVEADRQAEEKAATSEARLKSVA